MQRSAILALAALLAFATAGSRAAALDKLTITEPITSSDTCRST